MKPLVQNVICDDVDDLRDKLTDLQGGISAMLEILPAQAHPLRKHLQQAYQALMLGKGHGTAAEALNKAFDESVRLARAGKI